MFDVFAIATFISGYLEAFYFADTGEDGQPPSDIEPNDWTVELIRRDAEQFLALASELILASPIYADHIGEAMAQAGRDFYFTREGHGVGFWDREEFWGEHGAEALTELCKRFGPVEFYEGDDGSLYQLNIYGLKRLEGIDDE